MTGAAPLRSPPIPGFLQASAVRSADAISPRLPRKPMWVCLFGVTPCLGAEKKGHFKRRGQLVWWQKKRKSGTPKGQAKHFRRGFSPPFFNQKNDPFASAKLARLASALAIRFFWDPRQLCEGREDGGREAIRYIQAEPRLPAKKKEPEGSRLDSTN